MPLLSIVRSSEKESPQWIALTGRARMFENEGGFASPGIEIELDGGAVVMFDRELYKFVHGGLPRADRGGCIDRGCEDLGRIRITVEKVSS